MVAHLPITTHHHSSATVLLTICPQQNPKHRMHVPIMGNFSQSKLRVFGTLWWWKTTGNFNTHIQAKTIKCVVLPMKRETILLPLLYYAHAQNQHLQQIDTYRHFLNFESVQCSGTDDHLQPAAVRRDLWDLPVESLDQLGVARLQQPVRLVQHEETTVR